MKKKKREKDEKIETGEEKSTGTFFSFFHLSFTSLLSLPFCFFSTSFHLSHFFALLPHVAVFLYAVCRYFLISIPFITLFLSGC